MAQQVAIITGAGGGIGRAIAIELGGRGYRLLLVGRTESKLRETARVVGDAQVLVADLAQADSVDRIVNHCLTNLGGIHALVNNAGIAPLREVEQTTDRIWREVLETNLSAVFYLCRAAWPVFREQKSGVIVNISSLAARDPFPGFAAYGAAKAGLNTLGISLAQEGSPLGIRVHTIAPGAVETDLLRTVVSKDQLPTSQTLSPADVARAVGACVTGETQSPSGDVIWLLP